MADGVSGSYYDRLVAKRKQEQQQKLAESKQKLNNAVRFVIKNESIQDMVKRWKKSNFKREGQ